MKKSILLLSIITVMCFKVKAQTQKVLPDTIKVTLTRQQLQTIASKLDSVENMIVRTSTLPAYQVMDFNMRLQQAFVTLWQQANKQLVDSVKVQTTGK